MLKHLVYLLKTGEEYIKMSRKSDGQENSN